MDEDKTTKSKKTTTVVFNNSTSIGTTTNDVHDASQKKRTSNHVSMDKLRDTLNIQTEEQEDTSLKQEIFSKTVPTTKEVEKEEEDYLQDEIFGNGSTEKTEKSEKSEIVAVVPTPQPKKAKSLKSLKKYKDEKKEEINEDEKRKHILNELDRIEREEYHEEIVEDLDEEEEKLPFNKKNLHLESFKDVKVKEGYLIMATKDQERAHKRFIIASKGVDKVLITVWSNDKGPKSFSPIHKLYSNQKVIQEKYPFKTTKKTLSVEKNVSFIHSLEIIPTKGGPNERLRLWAETEKEAAEWEYSIDAMLKYQEKKEEEVKDEVKVEIEVPKEEIKQKEEIDEKKMYGQSNTGRVGKLKGFFSKLIASNTETKKTDSTPKKRNFSLLKK